MVKNKQETETNEKKEHFGPDQIESKHWKADDRERIKESKAQKNFYIIMTYIAENENFWDGTIYEELQHYYAIQINQKKIKKEYTCQAGPLTHLLI